jgi:hypothetical protein
VAIALSFDELTGSGVVLPPEPVIFAPKYPAAIPPAH